MNEMRQQNLNSVTENETIAAISTAVSEAGIGIIRISGPQALQVADRVCVLAGKQKSTLTEVPSHTIHYGYVVDPVMENDPAKKNDPAKENDSENNSFARKNTSEEKNVVEHGDIIDEVLISVMRAPRSFTAEDTVEINCHGGVYALRRCLEAVLHAGARAAQPGEFTKRAFLNGRIDLSSAEAVMDVIHAKSELSLKSSLQQLKGSVYHRIRTLRSSMLEKAAYIEAALDDPEHYSLDGFSDQLRADTEEWKTKVEQLICTAEEGRLVREGINTAIIGKPNAGKSSLLNVLAGSDLAIVTEIAGTTRDVLTQTLRIGDVVLNVADTAGIREAKDKVEQIGIERALSCALDSDLVLYVADASLPIDEWDRKILEYLSGRKIIALLNKSDLPAVTGPEQIRPLIGENGVILSISAREGTGLEALRKSIMELFYGGDLSFNDEVVITNIRHKECLEKAKSSLELLEECLAMGYPEDICSIDLTDAIDHLGEITGETMREDLIDEIFGKFCMGK